MRRRQSKCTVSPGTLTGFTAAAATAFAPGRTSVEPVAVRGFSEGGTPSGVELHWDSAQTIEVID